MSSPKKIVVIGGSGLIGTKVVALLKADGHDALAASPSTGINVYTGEGLDAALAGADAVIDTSNLLSFERDVVRDFFGTCSRNLAAAGKQAGVRHHVVLSIVGTDGLVSNPYLDGKMAQEAEVRSSGAPYTIVRATQFFEFLSTLAEAYTSDGVMRVPAISFQPIAADDVAALLVKTALSTPKNGILDIAGPELASFKAIMQDYLAGTPNAPDVIADKSVSYFGATVTESSLVPNRSATLGHTTVREWLDRRSKTAA
ncbi:MAG: NAD(P)H-binding protein [Rhizobium sp.]|nr:NAD(P)H-binding protein [Rhizobium sp.]